MNKVYGQTLLDDMVRQQSLPMPLVKQAAREILAVIREGLIRDGVVNVSNFGTFRLKSVAARQGINPQTRETITIPAHQRVIFSPCKALREMIQPVHTPPGPIQPSITTKSSDKSVTRVAVSSSAKERIQPDELPPSVAATTKEVVTPTPLDSTSRSDFLTPLSSDEATEKPACAQRELAETDASHIEPVMEPKNEIAAIQTPVPPENSDCAESVNISLELSEDKKAETEDCNISKNRPYYLGAAAVLVITLVSAILLTDSTPNIENEETGLITAAPELKSPASDLNLGESHPNVAAIMVNTNGAGLSEKSDRSNNNQEVNENTAASATIPPSVPQGT